MVFRYLHGMDNPESAKILVAIVEDNPDLREGLCQVVQLTNEFVVAEACSNGEEALTRLPESNAQIVLMDINLGGVSGIEVVKQLKAKRPEMLFMMCTVYEDDDKIFDALRAGASGYILKKTAPNQLVDAIRELYHGGSPMTPLIARKVVAAFTHPHADATQNDSTAAATPTANDRLSKLSKREKEILEMMASGKLYKEIADSLFISPETVRKHVYRIYEKLHVSNRIEAVNRFFGR